MPNAIARGRSIREVRAPERMTQTNLVEAALARYGGTAKSFAEEELQVDEATLRRWRRETTRLNRFRRRWFEDYVRGKPRQRTAS